MVTTTFQLGDKYMGHPVLAIFVRNNAPVSGFYAGAAPPGALVLDMTAGVLYQNTGTLDASTWAVFGVVAPSGFTLPAVTVASAIPAADPHVVGRVWANSGVLTVSAG